MSNAVHGAFDPSSQILPETFEDRTNPVGLRTNDFDNFRLDNRRRPAKNTANSGEKVFRGSSGPADRFRNL
jgi:hypothetical protein